MLRLILGLVLAGAAYFVAANSHFDIFPCKEYRQTEFGQDIRSGECSIMEVQRTPYPGERAELEPEGYALAIVVLGIVPLLLGIWIGGRLTRKKI